MTFKLIQKDPVCRRNLSIEDAAGRSEFGRRLYYFCSSECLKKFERDPGLYIEKLKAGTGVFHEPVGPS